MPALFLLETADSGGPPATAVGRKRGKKAVAAEGGGSRGLTLAITAVSSTEGRSLVGGAAAPSSIGQGEGKGEPGK